MKREELKLSDGCSLVKEHYGDFSYVMIEYIERSTDHYHSDSETQVDIDIDLARKIVKTLESYFGKKIYE